MADLMCERCASKILRGQFYIEARRREDKPFRKPRPGIDNGLNLDPYVFIHIPSCGVYTSSGPSVPLWRQDVPT